MGTMETMEIVDIGYCSVGSDDIFQIYWNRLSSAGWHPNRLSSEKKKSLDSWLYCPFTALLRIQ